MSNSDDRRDVENSGDRDDVPPDGKEAEAQSTSTIMPWIWAAVGIMVVAIFIVWAVFQKPLAGPHVAPVTPAGQGPAITR